MINIGGQFPTKRNATTDKKPTTPLETKKCPGVNRELDMVVTGFIVANSLKEVGKNILRQVLNTVQRKRPILNPKVKKSIVITKAWFGRFYRKRHNKVRRRTFSYLTPKRDGAGS